MVDTRVSKGRDVPRDVPGQTGTGHPVVPLSRDKKNSLSRCPFVPGQKSFACPAVPLSRDKGRSKCPGTKPSVPGRPGTKWVKKFSNRMTKFSVLEHPFPVFCSFGKVILSRDGTGQRSLSRDICSCPCPGTKGHRDKNFFLSRDKGTTGRPVPVCPGTSRGTSRPLETLV